MMDINALVKQLQQMQSPQGVGQPNLMGSIMQQMQQGPSLYDSIMAKRNPQEPVAPGGDISNPNPDYTPASPGGKGGAKGGDSGSLFSLVSKMFI